MSRHNKHRRNLAQHGRRSPQAALTGLEGEIVDAGGKVEVTVPPLGQAGAIRWRVNQVYPAGVTYPTWADVNIGNKVFVRINPDLIQAPFTRFAECLMLAYQEYDNIPWQSGGTVALASFPPDQPNAEEFIFARTHIGEQEVVMIDRKTRADQFSPDGQGREYKLIMGQQRLLKNLGHEN